MKYEIASVTHIGHVRRTNQDRILVCSADKGGKQLLLAAVADGMGGLQDGEKASQAVVSLLQEWWEQFPNIEIQPAASELDAVIYEAHRQIYYRAAERAQQSGSTLSLLFLQGECGFIKQIGDSRIYEIRPNEVEQLTIDQTWYNRVIGNGELTPEQAARSRMRNALVNALGASEELEITTQWLRPTRGTSYLLCSDGFYHTAPLADLPEHLQKQTVKKALEHQIQAVLAGAAADNASAILCRVQGL